MKKMFIVCIFIINLFKCLLNKRNLSSISSMIQDPNPKNNVVNPDKISSKGITMHKPEIKDMYLIQKSQHRPDKMYLEI